MSPNRNADRETIATLFESPREFDDLLETAERQASRGNEIEFVAGLRARYDRFGTQCFLSGKQRRWLEQIAKVNP